MLIGTASVEQLAAGAATIPNFVAEPVVLRDVTCLQITAEMHNAARESVLPPSLHPTVPPSLSIQVWSVGDGPWGAFCMAIVRISCRSGVRARGFTTGACASTQTAAQGLQSTFGFPMRVAHVTLRHSYLGVDCLVESDNRKILSATGLDPEPMGANDVQYTGTLNLAHTPNGLRLVQVEAHHTSRQVERLSARLTAFDPAAWGNPLLDPYLVVSASATVGDVEFPGVRFVCKPDELAFTGTEPAKHEEATT